MKGQRSDVSEKGSALLPCPALPCPGCTYMCVQYNTLHPAPCTLLLHAALHACRRLPACSFKGVWHLVERGPKGHTVVTVVICTYFGTPQFGVSFTKALSNKLTSIYSIFSFFGAGCELETNHLLGRFGAVVTGALAFPSRLTPLSSFTKIPYSMRSY
jgi:hypothetical protein